MEQDTEIAQTVGAEEFNSADLAWSEDSAQWRTPTYPYRPRGPWWRRILAVAKYALPAVIVGAVVMLLVGGHHAQQESPMPAPPQAAIPQPTITGDRDSVLLNTLGDAGWAIYDKDRMISSAHWACNYMSNGHSQAQTVDVLDHSTRGEQVRLGETPDEHHTANLQFVQAATKAYCPQLNN